MHLVRVNSIGGISKLKGNDQELIHSQNQKVVYFNSSSTRNENS